MEPLIAMENANEKSSSGTIAVKDCGDTSSRQAKYTKFDADDFIDFITSDIGTSVAYGLSEITQFKEGVQIGEAVAGLHNLRRDRTESYLDLVKLAITSEISKQAQENTILRGNSVCTKFMSASTQMYGEEYLRQVLVNHIKEVCEKGPHLELDPNKTKPDDDLVANQELLTQYCQQFFDSIVSSIALCPTELRIVCKHLEYEVNKKFPEGGIGRRALAAFFFLRFVCPAIFLPATHGLIPMPPSPTANRGLTLISKTIQSLASGSEGFSVKENFLAVMKDFIVNNRTTLYNFLDELPNIDEPSIQKKTNVVGESASSKGKEKDEDDSAHTEAKEDLKIKRAASDTTLHKANLKYSDATNPKRAAHIDTIVTAISTHREALEKFLLDETHFNEAQVVAHKESLELLNSFVTNLKKAPSSLKEMNSHLRASSPSIMDASAARKGKRESRKEKRIRERASRDDKKNSSTNSTTPAPSSRRCIIL